jgi:hypothetical protein
MPTFGGHIPSEFQRPLRRCHVYQDQHPSQTMILLTPEGYKKEKIPAPLAKDRDFEMAGIPGRFQNFFEITNPFFCPNQAIFEIREHPRSNIIPFHIGAILAQGSLMDAFIQF